MSVIPIPLLIIGLVFGAVAAQAQDTSGVSIELNAAKTQGNQCQLSFVVQNDHPSEISKAVYETVLFDAQGQVERLTLLDFGTLPAARPRVRQFALSGVTCNNLGQVLINGAHACVADELGNNACEDNLKLITRTDIEVTG